MKVTQHGYPTHNKQRILEQTLLAVRERKQRQTNNRYIAAAVCCVALVATMTLLVFRGHDAKQAAAMGLNTTRPHAPSTVPQDPSTAISIRNHTNVYELTLSHQEIARIIYDPQLKFTEGYGVYTWKGTTKTIHMNMPKTMLAITDSSID